MQTLIMIWKPNAAWYALSLVQKMDFLRSLDARINLGRAAGMVVLGWSKVDPSLPQSPQDACVGVFGVSDAQSAHTLVQDATVSGWYGYFDSNHVSVNLTGATEAEPHKIYAQMLGLSI